MRLIELNQKGNEHVCSENLVDREPLLGVDLEDAQNQLPDLGVHGRFEFDFHFLDPIVNGQNRVRKLRVAEGREAMKQFEQKDP